MSQTFQRRPGGEPAGGQFTGRERPDGDLRLTDTEVSEAESYRTSTDRLCDLAESVNPEVRAAVAANPRCEPEVRRYLSYDAEASVREALAQAEKLEGDIIYMLGNDSDARVRAAAASHPGASSHQLTVLTADDVQFVRDAAELELHRRGLDAESGRVEMIERLELINQFPIGE